MSRPLVIIAGDFPFPIGTASAARLRNLSLGFVNLGYDVHIAAFGNTGEGSVVDISPFITCTPRPSASLPFRNRSFFAKVRWLLSSVRTSRKSIQLTISLVRGRSVRLVVIYGRSYLRLHSILVWARKHKIPVVLDCVEANSSFVGLGGRLSPVYWDWALGERLLPQKVDAMSVITRKLSESAKTRGCTRVYLVPAAEDFSAAPPEYPTNVNIFRIAYVGALLARDNPTFVADLAEILVRSGGVALDILGRYDSVPEAAPFVARLRALESSGLVSLHGAPDDSKLAATLARADALLLPRRNSPAEIAAFPTRLAECLRTARPVLASAVGDIPFHLRDGVDAVLLDSSDVVGAAAKVVNLSRLPDRGAAIGRAGYLRGRERFDRMTHARELLTLADEIRKA